MGKVFIILSDSNEEWLRDIWVRKKGDLSNVVNALVNVLRTDAKLQQRVTQEMIKNINKAEGKKK